MIKPPENAFILAAGMGTRLRPYTDHCPKPMVSVGGKSVINRALDHLEAAGVEQVTVNLHYMADMLAGHLQKRASPKITFSREGELLNTGGGVKRALATMDAGPFYIINGDAVWTDGPSGSALLRLSGHFDPATMDMLLLLQPVHAMHLTHGVGDYTLGEDGRATRSREQSGDLMFTSLRIVNPEIFHDTPDGAFSFLDLMDRAEAAGRLYGLAHDGDWHHISTPEELEAVNATFAGHGEGA